MYTDILKRVHSQTAALIGRNFSLTPAVIEIVNGRKYEIYFAYNAAQREGISRPYLKFVTDYKTGLLLEFKNAYYSDFADSKKYPLDKKFSAKVPAATTVKEQGELLKNLKELYEKVRAFAFAEEISDAERDILNRYAKILAATVPAELLDFCKYTAPEFFRWIENHS